MWKDKTPRLTTDMVREGAIEALKLAAELVSLNCDVIVVAGGYSWTRAVMDATKTIPIVMAGGGFDPVEAGLIKSLARPGGNVTGITNLTVNLSSKRLELFKEGLPKMARVAVLYDSGNPGDQRLMKEDFPAVARAPEVYSSSLGGENGRRF